MLTTDNVTATRADAIVTRDYRVTRRDELCCWPWWAAKFTARSSAILREFSDALMAEGLQKPCTGGYAVATRGRK